MKDKLGDQKNPIRSIFKDQKSRLEKALEYYKSLEKNLPPEEEWKIMKSSPLHDSIGGILARTTILPSEILLPAIQTMDEYIDAIDAFSDDQFAAFMLGVCVNWIPIQYWGIEELSKQYEQIQRRRAYYEKVEAEIPEEEFWRLKEMNPFAVLTDTTPPGEKMPSEILEIARSLVECLLRVLSERPF